MIHVLTHGNCYDGFGAYWSARRYLEQKEIKDVKYNTAVYGGKLENPKDSLVVFIDFCPEDKKLLNELQQNNLVIILDHHVTAQENLKDATKLDFNFDEVLNKFKAGEKGLYCLFDMDQSGAGIAYRYFFQTDVVPNMIRLIEDRDTWKFKYKESKDFHSYLLSKPFDYDVWTKVFEDSSDKEKFSAIIKAGEALTEYSDQIVSKICALASVQTVAGLEVGFVNTTSHWAEVGEFMVQKKNLDYSIAFTIDFSLGMIKGSIRRPTGLDCTKLAEHFGGGGHKGAAGFSVSISKGIQNTIYEIEEWIANNKDL